MESWLWWCTYFVIAGCLAYDLLLHDRVSDLPEEPTLTLRGALPQDFPGPYYTIDCSAIAKLHRRGRHTLIEFDDGGTFLALDGKDRVRDAVTLALAEGKPKRLYF